MATTSRSTSRDLALIAVFAGITAVLGFLPPIHTGLSPVPITAQSLGVMLAGAILGARRGMLSQLLLMVLVAVGLPFLAGGRGGLGVFAGPTVGFLIGYVVSPWVIGKLTERRGAPYSVPLGILFNVIGGIVVMYFFGIIGMYLRLQMSLKAVAVANAPFLIGDSIKAVLTALVAAGVHRAYPGLLRQR
ncbi:MULTISPECIES: biotin transporter BioY [unclassified Luteococcus]|uniref:biotin transporter BioY n=1 Tax=unclassified Luteococcus TaxID=2639923 RepID=UPI00313DB402